MPEDSHERSIGQGAEPHERGSRPVQRIPPSNYSSKFLSDLRAQGQVLAVDDNWAEGKGHLPPGINWVLFPNGDLQRVGTS